MNLKFYERVPITPVIYENTGASFGLIFQRISHVKYNGETFLILRLFSPLYSLSFCSCILIVSFEYAKQIVLCIGTFFLLRASMLLGTQSEYTDFFYYSIYVPQNVCILQVFRN